MRAILGTLCLVAVLATSSAANARTLCCELFNGASCFTSATGVCPTPLQSSPAWLSIAVSPSAPSNSGAVVQIRYNGPFEGICFVDHDTAGQYVVPSMCVKLVKPPGTTRPLITVSESFVPYGGNAFAVAANNNFAQTFAGGLYTSCFLQADLKDDWGVATYGVGSGYTCSLTKQMTFSAGGIASGSVHYLPGVSTAPILGGQPQLTTSTAYHKVGQSTMFHVRAGRPHTGILWTRSVNNQTVQALVPFGITDQYGSADIAFPPWVTSDVGNNSVFVFIFQAASPVLSFPVHSY